MKTCIDCGKPLNAGSSGGTSGERCLICKTARSLRMPVRRRKHRVRAEFVRELATGVRGRVLRRVWLKTDAPAELAYVVKFEDGREKRMLKTDVAFVEETQVRGSPACFFNPPSIVKGFKSMTTERIGDWMQTIRGGQFWPLDPRVSEIDIYDIAHALSMQCRYSGHCLHFYSVAEHCCHIADACPPEAALWGLLHDASEAYLADVIRPIKPFLTGYKSIEAQLMACICERFGLPIDQPEIVSELDRRILGNECAEIMAPPPVPWYHTGEPIATLRFLPCWSPNVARHEFLTRFYRITANEVSHATN